MIIIHFIIIEYTLTSHTVHILYTSHSPIDTGYTLYTCGSNDASSGALVPLTTQLIITLRPTIEYSLITNMIHEIYSTMD